MSYTPWYALSFQGLPGVVRYISVNDIPQGGVNNCYPPPSPPEKVRYNILPPTLTPRKGKSCNLSQLVDVRTLIYS